MTTLAKNAYQHVQGRIANGSLAPGDLISESAIAKELGYSRTPIGEALRRLSEDGLVQQVPRYGTIVRHISLRELKEDFEIREALETYAARSGAERITQPTIRDLKKLCDRIDREIANVKSQGQSRIEGDSLRRFLAADMAFHLLIISSAGNEKLVKLAQRAGSVAQIFQTRRGSHTLVRVENANEMHKSIVEALEKKDADAAGRLVAQHIRFSADISIQEERLAESAPASLSGLDLPGFLKDDLSSSI